MKKSILVFHPALAPYRVDFFNALHRSFNAHFYFNLANVSDQKFDQQDLQQRSEFKYNVLNKGLDLGGRSFRLGIISTIKKHKPNIILCSEYGQITCVVLAYVKIFHRNIKLYTLSDDSIDNAIERKGIRALLRIVIAKYIDGIIFTSEQVCKWFNENISSKTKTLELPIIHHDAVLRSKYLESLKVGNFNIGKYGLKGKKVILFVGRLVDVKNLPFLIRGFSEVENHNCKLVLVGDGHLKEELKSLTVALNIADKVIFTGREEGLALNSWYTFSQIFAFPSTNERFGAVVNEALLGGCYTLCSSTAGASSLINQSNGKLFDPKNKFDFIGKLQIAINDSEPLDPEITVLRSSKMPFRFDEKIDVLIKEL
jgi:glycosyltransferase involved in cell wall biosynthesis